MQDAEFASTTDERSMARAVSRKRTSTTVAMMKAFVESFMRSKGQPNFIGRRAEEVDMDQAPVLKPRRGKPMRYRFTA